VNDRALIEEAIADFIAAYNRGDVTAVLDCYSDDLVKLRQGADAETKQQTSARLADTLRENVGRLAVQNDEIVVSGDIAFTRGILRIVLTRKGPGEEQRFERRLVEL
jgi:ketosteroid isomerase-like protein